jgi:hypothetical protein
VKEIRALCRLMVEQQENILRLISDKLDELYLGGKRGEGVANVRQ